MAYIRIFILVIITFLPHTVLAEMEKFARNCDQGICLYFWPKVIIPAGWEHSQAYSYYYSFNAVVPNGQSFKTAETVMYAKANYKPKEPETKSLDAFIAPIRRTSLIIISQS